MKIKINKNLILKKIEKVIKITSDSYIIPILKGILFEIKKDKITLKATDGNLSIKETIDLEKVNSKDVTIFKTGNFIVKGSLLREIIKKSSDDIIIYIDSNNHFLKINSANFKTNLKLFKIDNFPHLNFELVNSNKFIVDKKAFISGIEKVAYASSYDIRQMNLNCINVQIQESSIQFTATDRFRIATFKATKIISNFKNSEVEEMNIYNKNIKCFKIFQENSSKTFEFVINNNKMLIQDSETIINSNLVEDVFPDIKKLFPKKCSNVLTIKKRIIVNAIDRTSIFSDNKTKKIKFAYKNNEIKILSENDENGNIEIDIKDFVWTGEDVFTISFNYGFLKEAIQNLENDVLLIKFNGELQPFVVVEKESEKNIALITPLRDF